MATTTDHHVLLGKGVVIIVAVMNAVKTIGENLEHPK